MALSDRVELLLVEDNPDDVELTLHTLEDFNFTDWIHVARDGAEALDFIFRRARYAGRNTQDPPRVILLDIKLPKVDGLEVLRQLKADPTTRLIPVVMLTSSQEERDLVESYRLGVNSYITKPVSFDQFVAAVRSLGTYWLFLNKHPSSHAA